MSGNGKRRDIIWVLVATGLAVSILVAGPWLVHNLRQATSATSAKLKLDVFAVPAMIQMGMSESQVRGLLGKPHSANASETKGTKGLIPWKRVLQTSAQLVYWNPKQGYNVAVVRLKDDQVHDVQVKRCPRWASDYMPMGKTKTEIQKALGRPSHTNPRGFGPAWVYTDRKALQETMVLQFDAKGRANRVMFGPNQAGLDGP